MKEYIENEAEGSTCLINSLIHFFMASCLMAVYFKSDLVAKNTADLFALKNAKKTVTPSAIKKEMDHGAIL